MEIMLIKIVGAITVMELMVMAVMGIIVTIAAMEVMSIMGAKDFIACNMYKMPYKKHEFFLQNSDITK
jgi:hypothetical protein